MALLPVRHLRLLPLAATGEATGSPSYRTLPHRRLLSTSMTTAIACHSRSHQWPLVHQARLVRILFAHTNKSLSVLRLLLTVACLLRLRTSSRLPTNQRRQISRRNTLLSEHLKVLLNSRLLLVKVRLRCSVKAVLLRPTAFSPRRATPPCLPSTASKALALKFAPSSTTRRLRLVVDSPGRLTSTTQTRACRRSLAEHRRHPTRNSQLMPPRVKGRRGLAALRLSAFANGRMTQV